ncbi:hypothetical protein GOP47_0024645 [Adiantum capillus-veneris]|uniref:Uncharacterized protein n=1 Tax=Adiantum capillus-veneris TaxID=13818 RepID=A0A9D4U3D2_ADICA|nr:hypothetical protein GOP47_0024645 [Adiantum capillus-veneris]
MFEEDANAQGEETGLQHRRRTSTHNTGLFHCTSANPTRQHNKLDSNIGLYLGQLKRTTTAFQGSADSWIWRGMHRWGKTMVQYQGSSLAHLL